MRTKGRVAFIQKLDEEEMKDLASRLKEARKEFAPLQIFNDEEEECHLSELARTQELENCRKNHRKHNVEPVRVVINNNISRFYLESLTDEEFVSKAKYAIEEHNNAVDKNIEDEFVKKAAYKLVFKGLAYATRSFLRAGFNYYLVLVAACDSNNDLVGAYETVVRRSVMFGEDGKLKDVSMSLGYFWPKIRKGTALGEEASVPSKKVNEIGETSTGVKSELNMKTDRKRTALGEETALPAKKVKESSETSTGMKSELATTTDRKRTAVEEAMHMSTEKIDKRDEISTRMKAVLMTTQDRSRAVVQELDEEEMKDLASRLLEEARKKSVPLLIFNDEEEKHHLSQLARTQAIKNYSKTPAYRLHYFEPRPDEEFESMAKYAVEEHNNAVEKNIEDEFIEKAAYKLVFKGLASATKSYLRSGFNYCMVFAAACVSNNDLVDAYEAMVMCSDIRGKDGKMKDAGLCSKSLAYFRPKMRETTAAEEAMPMSTEKIDKRDEISTRMKAALMTTHDRSLIQGKV